MSAATFSNDVKDYAEFIGQKRGQRIPFEELERIRVVAYSAFGRAEEVAGRAKIDGLECVEWVKKYRNDNRTTLVDAKAAWDSRILAARK